jgi:hypothetical protein
MHDLIPRTLEWLRLLFAPGTGKRRRRRPDLAAHEQEVALQQRRRLALVLAAGFGIDLDRHLIGAQELAA